LTDLNYFISQSKPGFVPGSKQFTATKVNLATCKLFMLKPDGSPSPHPKLPLKFLSEGVDDPLVTTSPRQGGYPA